jgi:hypothetical protein
MFGWSGATIAQPGRHVVEDLQRRGIGHGARLQRDVETRHQPRHRLMRRQAGEPDAVERCRARFACRSSAGRAGPSPTTTRSSRDHPHPQPCRRSPSGCAPAGRCRHRRDHRIQTMPIAHKADEPQHQRIGRGRTRRQCRQKQLDRCRSARPRSAPAARRRQRSWFSARRSPPRRASPRARSNPPAAGRAGAGAGRRSGSVRRRSGR